MYRYYLKKYEVFGTDQTLILYKTNARNNPKKFLENRSRTLYKMFFHLYDNRDATPYNAHMVEKYQNVDFPMKEYFANSS